MDGGGEVERVFDGESGKRLKRGNGCWDGDGIMGKGGWWQGESWDAKVGFLHALRIRRCRPTVGLLFQVR